METFFIDTNLLIQCKELKQLPWREISDDSHILLVVSRPVLEEIDRHKQNGNTRRAKRSRKATSYFRNLILNKANKDIIKESNPKVELSICTAAENEQSPAYEILDLTKADDRIIKAALVYKSKYPNVHVQLLTHDTNPLLTAQSCTLDCSIIPETWLLPPEPDARDKKIAELERKFKELENSAPKITLKTISLSSETITTLPINIILYEKLSESQLEELIKKAQDRSPLVSEFEGQSSLNIAKRKPTVMNLNLDFERRYQPPSNAKITKYSKEKYPTWVKDVKRFFQELNSNLEDETRTTSCHILLENKGSIPAENLVIEFQALGGLFLSPPNSKDDEKTKNSISFPKPPTPPSGTWVSYQHALVRPFANDLLGNFNLANFAGNNERDRHAFYWKDGKPPMMKKKWILECSEFRHLVKPEKFEINLVVPPNLDSKQGALKCLVTAKNLPEPVEYFIPVTINYEKGDSYKKSKQYLNKFLPKSK